MGDAVRASTELRAQGGIGSARGGEEIGSGEKDGIRSELEESRLVRTQAAVVGDGEAKAGEVVKKRRGRPPRDQGKIPPTVMDNDDEDVCFICFDGGSLVLCDRRGCPKAYHPACIKRDEAFFQSAARWNCGWHICSTCQKTSHFMCYTCTFSLCKRCTKGVDFLCVRGNKGFCNICLNMVKLIENSEQGNKEMAQVDFDDKTSWEYLFKVYWIYLKTKLSLTFDELKKAKRVDVSVSLSRKGRNSDDLYANNRSCSDSDYLGKSQEEPHSKRRKTRQWPIALPKEAPQREEQVGAQISSSHPTPTAWASKDLLEFVSNMTKGDTSSLTPFDAQSLLLHYIKINGLRDPNCQSQIICDSRLRNMFGKARIGHIEMLNLVEYHFPSRQQSHAEIAAYIGRNDSNGVKVVEVDESNPNHLLGKDMKSKRHKKDDNKGRETIHDGYAAIDVHNINLIYLPLHLMEKLLVDDKFHEKVVGSIVRIKMSSSDQKQDMYRLVQVVGTIKIDELYKVRNRLSGWKLEILNISKKEIISIDEISDQEFSEDECERFRQSIKYGLATGFTVGEMLEKAVVLRTVKVTNFIETETLRFQHLRDRATEKGQNKEFKEYVHKIELLNSPGEHLHMQNEVPEVHEDPNMDPRHQSEEDIRLSFHKNHGDSTVAMQSGMKCKGNYSTSLLRFDSVVKKNRANAPWLSTSSKEDMKASSIHGRTDIPTNYLEQNAYLSNARNQIGNSDSSIQLKATSAINHSVVQNEMLCGAVTGTSGVPVSTDNVDTDKIWHYQDPSWNIQGPFSMLQLRKWNTSGYFPVDLRIWKTGEKQDESILLTDALEGQFCKKPRLIYNTCEMSIHSNASSEFVRSSCSSSLSTPAENVVNSREGQCADSLRSHKSLSSHSQFSSSPSTQTSAGKACEGLSLLAQESWNGPRCSDNYYPEHEVCRNQSSPIPNLNSEDLESQKAENKEVNLIPNLAEITRDKSAEEKQCVPSPIFHQAQLNSGVNLCSIASESQQMGTKQSAPYVHHIESEALHANPQLVIGGGQIQAVTAEHMNNDLKSQCTDNQTVVGSDLPLPDSDSGWTDGSCLLNASRDHPLMPVEQNAWTSNPLNGSLPKPNELVVDVTPTTDAALPTTGQYGFPSPFQFWHSIFGEDDEFPFADESVSDLLAEVDAMECLNGPASPTSDMVRDVEFSQTSKEDCFASVGRLKPNS